jgi:hypothetical protein
MLVPGLYVVEAAVWTELVAQAESCIVLPGAIVSGAPVAASRACPSGKAYPPPDCDMAASGHEFPCVVTTVAVTKAPAAPFEQPGLGYTTVPVTTGDPEAAPALGTVVTE